jgi:hypothetical protein
MNIEDVGYLNSILDSYDGIGIVRTIDKQKGYVVVYSSDGFFELVLEVFDALKKEGINITLLSVEKNEMVDEWS